MAGNGMSRRNVLRAGAGVIAATGALKAPMVHAQGTAGTLRCGFWEHWVPAGNTIIRELCEEWGARNRVEVKIDYCRYSEVYDSVRDGASDLGLVAYPAQNIVQTLFAPSSQYCFT